MVGRGVENEAVGVFQLHASYHTAHLLTSREHIHLLHHVFVFEEHASEEALHQHLVAFAILAEPIHEVEVRVEEFRVVEWQISRGDGHTPLIFACVRLPIAVDDLEESGHGLGVMAEEHGLLSFFYCEVHVVEEHCSVWLHRLEVLYFEYLCSWFAFHLEDDARVFP